MPPTLTDLQSGFELGPWTVIPERGRIRQGDLKEHLEPMVMDVLMVLARQQGKVVTRDQLVHEVWNDRFVADEAIVAKIATLRHKLGDDSKNPTYIETIPRRGYRLIMSVELPKIAEPKQTKDSALGFRRLLALAAVVAAAFLVYFLINANQVQIKSVAVLNLKNLSNEKQKFQYIVDGFREELVISLSQIPDLQVTRGPEITDERSAESIARDLNVDAVISGSLRTDGDKMLVTVELISADGFQIWPGRRFDGAAQSIFSLQETVATEVRDIILGEKGERIRSASRPANPEAFDRYMRGQFFLDQRDLESLQQAEKLFQETIDFDPNFGPAYLRLAITKLLLSDYHVDQRRQIFQQAIEIVKQGVLADPSIRSSAAMIYGFVDHQFGNWAAAEESFATAFQGVPVYPTAYQWHSRLLSALGLLDRAVDEAMTAVAMEPHSQVLNSRLAISYLWINDMVNARRYFNIANIMSVGSPIHHFAHTMFLIRENRLEAARASTKYALSLLPALNDWWVDAVFDGLANPDDQEIRAIAFETVRKMVVAGEPPYVTMIIWALFDRPDEVMAIATHVVESETLYAHESAQIELFYLDELSEFRKHKDFFKLLQILGLVDYWKSIGCRWSTDQVQCDAD
jgi:DNA-binding winged helix-turn-helix (wHTH) protein/TolB-like protein